MIDYNRQAAEEMTRQMEQLAKERMPELLTERHGLMRAFLKIMADESLRYEAIKRTQKVLGSELRLQGVGLALSYRAGGQVQVEITAEAQKKEYLQRAGKIPL